MERKCFFCYNSWLKALEPFGDAERGRIWTALLEYSNGLAIDGHSSGNERFILPMLIDQIDRDTQKNENNLLKSNVKTAKKAADRINPKKPKKTQKTQRNPKNLKIKTRTRIKIKI